MLFLLALLTLDDVATVKDLEIRLWEAWRTHDHAVWQSLTAPEYVCTDGAIRYDYKDIDQMFHDGRLEQYKTTAMQVDRITADVLVVTYRAWMKGTLKGKPFERNVAECSVWVRRNGKWLNAVLDEVDLPKK
jgi:hypothetical protein